MARKIRKWNRSAKASQFTIGAGGELVYTGRYYTFSEQVIPYRKTMVVRGVLSGISAVAVVAGGMMPVPALINTWYVILPYLFTLLSVASLVWAVCRMGYWGNPLREYVYDTTVKQLPLRMGLAMGLSMCTLCGQMCYLAFHGVHQEELFCSLAFLAFQVVIFVCCTLWRRYEQRWTWVV